MGRGKLIITGMLVLGLSVAAADRLADADPFLVSQLMRKQDGFKFSVMAQRIKSSACAYECWEKIRELNTVQLGCLNEQMTQVREMLSNGRNAAFLKKNGIEEIRINLTDNSNGQLPGEKKYEETKGYLLKWIMEVKTMITSKEECHAASAQILSDLIEHKVTDEALMEESIRNAQDILQTLIRAPRQVLPPREPATVEYETKSVGMPASLELNGSISPAGDGSGAGNASVSE